MQASSKAESLGLNLHFCILDSRINQNYIHLYTRTLNVMLELQVF